MNLIGQQVEQYLIQSKLGEGGMGSVYKALDVSLERVVALKFLNTGIDGQPDLLIRFRAEARAQAALNHHNIATLYAFLTWQGKAVMVMEYIEGETLQQMVARRGPIPSNVAVPLIRQALRGVGEAHRHGITHRDLKPANIMENREGTVKVMDFGIAKIHGAVGLTSANMAVGTPRYMSPEQVMGKPVDARSDIYSMGVTLYEMLAGQLPFNAQTDFEMQTAHVHATPESPTVHYPHIPQQVVDAVLCALRKDPGERFQTVDEFLRALPRDGQATLPANAVADVAMAATAPYPLGQSAEFSAGTASLATVPARTPAVAPDAPTVRVPMEPVRPQEEQVRQAALQRSRLWLVAAGAILLLLAAGLGLWLRVRQHDDLGGGAISSARVAVQADRPPGVIIDGPLEPVTGSGSGSGTDPGKPTPTQPSTPPPAKTETPPAKTETPPAKTETPPPPPPTAVTGLSGQWAGDYIDTASHVRVPVMLTMTQSADDKITGVLAYMADNSQKGSCQLAGSTWNEAKRELTLSTNHCSDLHPPAWFNVPTQFENVDPHATQLTGGRSEYVHNAVVVTLARR